MAICLDYYIVKDSTDILFGPLQDLVEAQTKQVELQKANPNSFVEIFWPKEQAPKRSRAKKGEGKGYQCKYCGQRIPRGKTLAHRAFEEGMRGIVRDTVK